MSHNHASKKPEANAPFRYDIVGSFLRPSALKAARTRFEAGSIDREELTRIEDQEIEALVAKQKAVGLQAVTDGEFRRSYWHLDFFWGLEGVEHVRHEHGYFFHGEETRPDSARLCGKLGFGDHPFLKHYAFLKCIAGEEVLARQTLPAPAQLYAELTRGENEQAIEKYYSDREELFEDLSQAYRDAILAFYALGCRNVQLDDCTWGMLCDEGFWTRMAGSGYDVDAIQALYLRLNNDALRDLPEDLVVTTHVCRGNYHSTWATSGGYGPVAKTLLAREAVSAFYLEYDTDRAGDFAPLAQVPSDKKVVLGLVTTKSGTLESKETLIRRIEEAAAYVPLNRLCLSPQCGFASTEEGNILTEEEQWAKLRLVRAVAEEVWG